VRGRGVAGRKEVVWRHRRSGAQETTSVSQLDVQNNGEDVRGASRFMAIKEDGEQLKRVLPLII